MVKLLKIIDAYNVTQSYYNVHQFTYGIVRCHDKKKCRLEYRVTYGQLLKIIDAYNGDVTQIYDNVDQFTSGIVRCHFL